MSHKQQKNKQPHLAVANMPFTPMTHKIEKPTATPYRLLQVNDLATPKINKSHSSVDKIEMIALQTEQQIHNEQQHQEHQQEKQEKQNVKHQQITKNQKVYKKPSNNDDNTEKDKENDNKNEIIDDSANDLKELKNALFTCLHVVERMEAREKEEEQRRKTYKNIQVQTSPLPPKMSSRNQRKQASNQLAENINNNSNEIISEKNQKHYNNLIKPSSGNKQNDEKNQLLANGSIVNDKGDTDLQEKMKAMNILLQKLQSRIDEIDNSSQKA